ncbi:hypothetical protein ACUXST_001390 [Sphingomonas sp. F9_3S_D5_B_2]
MAILDILKPQVDATVDALAAVEFRPDPIAGTLFSRMTSVLSSAYKRHGPIIERAIVECLNQSDRYTVWGVDRFGVQQQASTTVAAAGNNPETLANTHLPYVGDHAGDAHLQIDAVVFDHQTGIVSSYEIKRGNGSFDAGKQRSMKRDALLSKVLLRNHCISRGHEAVDSRAFIIFYYGIRSIPAPLGIIGQELDAHFGIPVWDEVETVNAYFRSRLFQIISQ